MCWKANTILMLPFEEYVTSALTTLIPQVVLGAVAAKSSLSPSAHCENKLTLSTLEKINLNYVISLNCALITHSIKLQLQ